MARASKLFLSCAAAFVTAMGVAPGSAYASIVGFDGTFALRNSTDGQVFCAIGSPCALAFEADTGITPVNGEFAQGRLLFSYDTVSKLIVPGSTLTLSSFFDSDTPTYAVGVSAESAGGVFLGCYAGISLAFGGASIGGGGSSIGGRVNYCLPGGVPGEVVDLDDFVASQHSSFDGSIYQTGVRGVPPTWGLTANGIALHKVPEPSTLAMAALGLALAALSARRRS